MRVLISTPGGERSKQVLRYLRLPDLGPAITLCQEASRARYGPELEQAHAGQKELLAAEGIGNKKGRK